MQPHGLFLHTLPLSLSPSLSKHIYKYKILRWRQYMVRPSSVLRCPSQGDVTKKDVRFCASRSLQCWVHRARTSANQSSCSESRRISQLTFAAENDCTRSLVSARTNVRVCAPQASLLDSRGGRNMCVAFFFTSIAFVFVHLFSPPKVFCFVYFFKVVADVICVPVRKWRGPANNLQDAWCARTVFRVCVCFQSFWFVYSFRHCV